MPGVKIANFSSYFTSTYISDVKDFFVVVKQHQDQLTHFDAEELLAVYLSHVETTGHVPSGFGIMGEGMVNFSYKLNQLLLLKKTSYQDFESSIARAKKSMLSNDFLIKIGWSAGKFDAAVQEIKAAQAMRLIPLTAFNPAQLIAYFAMGEKYTDQREVDATLKLHDVLQKPNIHANRRYIMVKNAIREGADTNCLDISCTEIFSISIVKTPASQAIQKQDLATLKILHAAGANLDEVTTFNDTLLHEAASLERTDIVKFLIDVLGVQALNTTNSHGETPLLEAASRLRLNNVQQLIDYGSDPFIEDSSGHDLVENILTGSKEFDGDTQLDDHPVFTSYTGEKHLPSLMHIIEDNHFYKGREDKVLDALIYAAQKDIRTFEYFANLSIELGVLEDFSQIAQYRHYNKETGKPLLHFAAGRCGGDKHIVNPVLKILLKWNANIDAVDADQITAVYMALSMSCAGNLTYLLEQKANLYHKVYNGSSAKTYFEYAVIHELFPELRILFSFNQKNLKEQDYAAIFFTKDYMVEDQRYIFQKILHEKFYQKELAKHQSLLKHIEKSQASDERKQEKENKRLTKLWLKHVQKRAQEDEILQYVQETSVDYEKIYMDMRTLSKNLYQFQDSYLGPLLQFLDVIVSSTRQLHQDIYITLSGDTLDLDPRAVSILNDLRENVITEKAAIVTALGEEEISPDQISRSETAKTMHKHMRTIGQYVSTESYMARNDISKFDFFNDHRRAQ